MPESYTERGFADYVTLTDRYGNYVIVRQSSLADEDCVWIFCNRSDKWPADLDSPDPSPHLTVDMARQVRDALDEFIRDHTPEATDGDS